MMKKKLKLMSVSFVALTLFSTATPTIASAAVYAEEEPVIVGIDNFAEEPTVDELQSLDKYVSVENNQFVLNLPENVVIDDVTYQSLVSNIAIANEEITNSNATINPVTKEITETGFVVFSSKGYRSQKFWWGERATYTNAQTNSAVKQLNVAAAQIGFGAVGLAFIPVVGTAAGGTAGITAAYLTLLSAKMDAANKGRGVIVDMTWALVFTVKSR